jgi:integrase
LSKEAGLIARVEKRREKPTPVTIFTPPELAALLKHASASVVPCVALSAFAGLRAEEIMRLDWQDVERRPGFIEVAAHKAKTATRRIVPVSDNLAQCLAIAPRNGERVWPNSKPWYFEALRNAADNAGVKWKTNALRHSFISYRLAEIQDVNRVALEAGNSPQLIFRHYRELATPQQARTWFAIAPEQAPNVVPLSVSAKQFATKGARR